MSEAPAPDARPRRRNTRAAPSEQVQDEALEAAPGQRLRHALSIAKLATFLVLLGGAVFGFAYGANRFFVSSSRFAIERLEVEGSQRFSDEQLLGLAGIRRGDNLFALDLEQAEQRLVSNPWIESVRLTRKIPDRIAVQIRERTAAALASIDGGLYLVTREGYPIKPVEDGDVTDFPVVTGIDVEALEADRARALERIASGIQLLRRYERLPLAKIYPAQEIHLAENGAVRLVIGSDGITLHLGRGPLRQKLLMAARVLGKLSERRQTPSIVFLDNQAHPERVVVRLR